MAGRPTKFDKSKIPILEMLYKKGFTDEEVATVIGVTRRTIENWKVQKPDFFHTIKDWKSQADAEVERSLYERACGYTCKDTKFATHEGNITDAREYDKHFPPDPTSMIFWLKNRKPNKWREKVDIESGGEPLKMAPAVIVTTDKTAKQLKAITG